MYINQENDENDENNKINPNTYKNILHNKKNKIGLINNNILLRKKDPNFLGNNYECKKGIDKTINNNFNNEKECLLEDEEEEDENDEEEDEDEDDDDDDDYEIDENDEEEDDDVFCEEEYDDETREINFNSYNNNYYETNNKKEDEDDNFLEKNIASDAEKDDILFEKYDKLIKKYKIKKETKIDNFVKKDTKNDESYSCYSSNSKGEYTHPNKYSGIKNRYLKSRKIEVENQENVNIYDEDDEVEEEDSHFSNVVLDRIEEIYYKKTKYKKLESINNSNNNICVNDLNLNIISDYLNVDISVFSKKTTVLLLGNTQSGKSSFINWFTESYVQNTNRIPKGNQMTYIDVKRNYKFNFKNFKNNNYQLGLDKFHESYYNNRYYGNNEYGDNYYEHGFVGENDKNVILSGENCFSIFKPFKKLKEKSKNLKNYIYGKLCYQNKITKYMNRVNSVSFIDTSGITDVDDHDYDELILNMSKYVDIIFIFIDSNTYSISNRLLKIMNYLLQNQISKVTICITRIDIIEKINLYRVVFYLTQHFLRNLNIFKQHINMVNPYDNSGEEVEYNRNFDILQNENIKENKKNDKIEKINEFFNRSIKSFQNLFIFPKMLKRIITNQNINEKKQQTIFKNNEYLISEDKANIQYNNYHKINKHDEEYAYQGMAHRPYIHDTIDNRFNYLNSKGYYDDSDKERVDEEKEESIFKKILTKSYNSFKDKIMNANNESENIIDNQDEDEQYHMNKKTRIRHDDNKNYSEFSIYDHKYYTRNKTKKKRDININSNRNIDENKMKREDKVKNHIDKIFENKINYGDCLKNMSIFVLVLLYEVITTIYSLIHSSINTYLNTKERKIINVEKIYKLDEANKLKYNINNLNDSYKILEFLTIYLPEIPHDVLKRENWKYEKPSLMFTKTGKHMNRYSYYGDYKYNNQYAGNNIERKLNEQNGFAHSTDGNNNSVHKKNNYIDSNKNLYERSGKHYHIRRSIPEDFSPHDKPLNSYLNKNRHNKNNYCKLNDLSLFDPEQIDEVGSRQIKYNRGEDNDFKYGCEIKRDSNDSINKYNEYEHINKFSQENNYNNRNKIRNDDIKELNMLNDLLYKIDEGIDLKTNQSIYMLKRDLEKIQNTCLRKIFDNNEIIQKNKSLRFQNIKLYFFKYMTIFCGFIISLLRYDFLVYFNFLKPKLLLSIFSKYFIFLSSYNKNSFFVALNILLIIIYIVIYFRYNKRNYFKSLDKSDMNKLKIILLFTQIIFDEINQLHLRLIGKGGRSSRS
ncbi:conserved Plasmodium protein, unknown function [Plasmodium berghei]|uniref:Dynamin N-terminal domain-containing protein n=2 Tax=Plasmodium berghei TaxID=5821 RepID=A0A509AU07_PLABA|nr:conserved Plasmodium protein, unknown function [Plasmodium berghei ANKA]SCM24902.1 conserved Plasmodium protein, unknown function [Plasmodium berghei]SCN27202.1 conserved Plasmodium protein, unknown function [Plasmodium berghei]SCO63626.1 conserved Plasmodium protein, unknown function [Plasmodium berghei]VUC57058.1 conserved Plasmodium protein, unknown function [Plasmodium berghei ANKA]|eukprot:XP_034422837.1 conserved Plasmodium protein, unknown function [Plasmodium berghei ANKA]